MNYEKPKWSGDPKRTYLLEVIKNGVVLDTVKLPTEKEFLSLGRLPECDVSMEHPSISRYHAVIQFNCQGDAFLYDLNSVHGTFLNKKKMDANVYCKIPNHSVFQLGQSSRLYVLNFLETNEEVSRIGETPSFRESDIRLGSNDHTAATATKNLTAELSDVEDATVWYAKNPKKILSEWLDERCSCTLQYDYLEEGDTDSKLYTAYVNIPVQALNEGMNEEMQLPSTLRGQGVSHKKREAERLACLDACRKLESYGFLQQDDIAITVSDYDRKMKRLLKRSATQEEEDSEGDTFYDRTGDGKIELMSTSTLVYVCLFGSCDE
jgi:pSer/pThr/pTyr-binding forkhead associated (FHA) protein